MNKKYVVLLSILTSLLWGSAFPVLKISYIELSMKPNDIFGKIFFAGIRFLGASLLILLFNLLFLKISLKIKKEDIFSIITLGIIGTSLQYFFFYTGLSNTAGMKASILSSSGVFFVFLFAHFFYKDDKMDKGKAMGLIFGFLGIIIINKGQSFSFLFNPLGEGFLILSALCSSIGTIYAKEMSNKINPFVLTFYQMLIGSLILIIISAPFLNNDSIVFNFKGSLLLIYTCFLSATAFTIFYSLLKYNKAGEISIYKFVIPIAGSILSLIFLKGETFSPNIIIALVLVVLGIIITNKK